MNRPVSKWEQIITTNPEHSRWYAERFEQMERAGQDLFGEARLLDALLPRNAKVLDAGCGPGRFAPFFEAAGHDLTGVDLDQYLIDVASAKYPNSKWHQSDLAFISELELTPDFDAVICAGNVMTFLAPETTTSVLQQLAALVKPEGRLAIGFGLGRGYELETFLADIKAANLNVSLLLESWDLFPFGPESNFVVAVLTKA